MDRRALVAVAGVVAIFLAVQLGALALVAPFETAGLQATENPSDPTNSLVYVGAILVATAVMLAAFRYDADVLVRLLVIASAAYLAFYVFGTLVPPALGGSAAAVGLALLMAAGLWFHPEWYVIDGAGVVMGIGASALFGISFGVLPALVLLTVLAVYDAISVYGTEHMLTLASGVMDLKLPVVLVVPLTLSYSFLDAEPPASANPDGDGGEARGDTREGAAVADGDGSSEGSEAADPDAAEVGDPLDRDAFFIGLGDAVMPAVLVASAAFFAPGGAPSLGVPGIALTLPALTAMVGTVLGLLVLMYQVAKGQAHAGLPLLNGGAIGGYLVGVVVLGLPLVEALGLAPYV